MTHHAKPRLSPPRAPRALSRIKDMAPNSGVDIDVLLPRPSAGKFSLDLEALLPVLVSAIDFIVLIGAGLLTLWLAPIDSEMGHFPLTIVCLAAITFVNLELLTGVFDVATSLPSNLKLMSSAFICAGTLGFFFLIFWLDGLIPFDLIDRFAIWGVLCLAGLSAGRLGLQLWVRNGIRSGLFRLRIVLVGRPNSVLAYLRRFATIGPNKPSLLAVVLTSGDPAHFTVRGVPVINIEDDLSPIWQNAHPDEILIALPSQANLERSNVIEKFRRYAANIRLLPELPFASFATNDALHVIAGLPTVTICEPPLNGWESIAKRIEDRVLSALAIIAFLPVMALICLAIKLTSSGPVVFRQMRHGFNHQEFAVYKFRTMRHAPEKGESTAQTTRNDPRVTAVGRLLRRTSLDELPQLFNVLKGDMSLVGPRPHAVVHNNEFQNLVDDYLCRHRVKPGITGWAQVNGNRGELTSLEKIRERIALDNYYVNNVSVMFDIQILLKTVGLIISGQNAY